MGDETKERRKFQRIFFSIEDGIHGTFAFSDRQKGSLTATIINLSEGGLGLALSKDKGKKIRTGDHVILTQVKGIQGLESLANVKAEIKWILDNPSLEDMGFGCEFLDIPASMRGAIQRFVNSWHAEKIGGSPK
jgi:c-di-GMP-binding flagellar brake protein YcgR